MRSRKTDAIKLLSALSIILLINSISNYWYLRFDLTKEKRFSLTKTTRKLLSSIDDYIYIEVYLEGEFPSGIERLSLETKYILSEFQSHNQLIRFRFINPTEHSDDKTRNEIINQLFEKGLNPITLQVKDGETYSEKIIVPGAIVKIGGKEKAVSLLKNEISKTPNQNIEQSIQELEYEFINAIKNLTRNAKSKVGLLLGHGELNGMEIQDFKNTLSEQYNLSTINLREFESNQTGEPKLKKKLNDLKSQEVLIIPKPKIKFENLDKYFIDQYLMNGGKVIWLIDATNAHMDSLSSKATFQVQALGNLNLSDQLFKYGIRLNSNLVQDISCSKIPIPTSFSKDIPKWELVPWKYFPVAIPSNNHTITTNLNAVKFDFTGSIDTVETNSKIKKTILLQTSPYTKLQNTPCDVSLQKALEPPNQKEFNRGSQALAVLLEGTFESVFKNRIHTIIGNLPFTERSIPTKMMVISDGDLITNQQSNGVPLPLGFDKYEKRQYGNKEFILNVIDYLLDEEELINVRSREVKLRPLDSKKINTAKQFWQLINIGLPILIIIFFGIIRTCYRKNKYNYEK